MLPKENRLTDDYDFRRVKRLGRNYHSSLFKLGVARRKKEGQASRFGFVISTKIDKRAAVRNRIKRLLREAIRQRLEKIPAGFDFVFVVRPKIVGKNYEEVSAEVDRVLSKISFH
jgi:ribonuclease P protein component